MKGPNDEGELGYGGACFPKDVTAFLAELRNFTLLNDVRLKTFELEKQMSCGCGVLPNRQMHWLAQTYRRTIQTKLAETIMKNNAKEHGGPCVENPTI